MNVTRSQWVLLIKKDICYCGCGFTVVPVVEVYATNWYCGCAVVAVAEVYGVGGTDLSIAARQGSGSACRSVLGGLVRWYKV